jgi:hypothetical protein
MAMAIDFFVFRQVTQLIEQKLEEARKSAPKAYTAATDASGVFAGDVAKSKAQVAPRPKNIAAEVTGEARHKAAQASHDAISGHLKGGKGVAVFLQKEPKFGDEHEGELERHYLVPHSDGSTYLMSGKKTHKVSGMSAGPHGFISVMPHSTGKKSVSAVGYIPTSGIRTFDPAQVQSSGMGKKFKMKMRGMPELD